MSNGTVAPGGGEASFLTRWTEAEETTHDVHIFQKQAGAYEKVKLHDFVFLGARFRPSAYFGRQNNKDGALITGETHTGAGVCAEMKQVLMAAQKDIFNAYAAEVRGQGETPSEAGFKKWCGVADLVGWQFRGGQHSRGSAIDIEPTFNPYVATKSGDTFGGEQYVEEGLPHTNKKITRIRERAFKAYTNAWRTRFGGTTEPNVSAFRAQKPNENETVAEAYDRFFDAHNTLVAYFDLVYSGKTATSLPATTTRPLRELGTFQNPQPGTFFGMASLYRGGYLPKLPSNEKELLELHEQVQADYAALRLVMVTGSLSNAKDNPGFASSGLNFELSRDPARGFLRIRKPIAVILREHLARWGAIDFGPNASGDIMHFDRGSEAAVATTLDPNPNNIFYAKR